MGLLELLLIVGAVDIGNDGGRGHFFGVGWGSDRDLVVAVGEDGILISRLGFDLAEEVLVGVEPEVLAGVGAGRIDELVFVAG